LASIAFPAIDPVLVSIGPFAVHWYGVAYIIAFVSAGLIARSLIRRWGLPLTDDDLIEILLAAVIGVILGGRLGYVLVYGGSQYIRHPLEAFAVWDGGMSFHGGLAGILVAAWVESRRKPVSFLTLADLGSVGTPVGIFFGRVANFVNAELWGRPTDLPWGVVFPGAGPLPRHPSQLYEALLEGVLLLVVMLVLARRRRPDGEIFGWFLILYGVFRIAVEFARQPDAQIGFIAGIVTMGQLLSVPMIVLGVWLVFRARRSGLSPATK
jgi:phosphatidylglycerol:prolipoprotein diacylglycerol transferase